MDGCLLDGYYTYLYNLAQLRLGGSPHQREASRKVCRPSRLHPGRGGGGQVPSSQAWTARSEVLKRGAPQQPRMHKSNNT